MPVLEPAVTITRVLFCASGEMHSLSLIVSEASRIVVFSGAGISTESGIDDFRGPQGVWKRHQPVYFDEFLADPDKRREHWKYKRQSWEQFKDAKPNAGHRAVLQWHEQGKLRGVITQNIDGLHEAAGLPREVLVELHGTNLHVECVDKDRQQRRSHCIQERSSFCSE